jgi:hypothetical protein
MYIVKSGKMYMHFIKKLYGFICHSRCTADVLQICSGFVVVFEKLFFLNKEMSSN